MTSRSRRARLTEAGMVTQREQKPDLRHHHPLPERHAALKRRDGDQSARLFVDQRSNRAPKQLRCMPGIRVGEEENVALGGPVALDSRPKASRTSRWAAPRRGSAVSRASLMPSTMAAVSSVDRSSTTNSSTGW